MVYTQAIKTLENKRSKVYVIYTRDNKDDIYMQYAIWSKSSYQKCT